MTLTEREHDDGTPTDRAFGNGPRMTSDPVPASSAVRPGPAILVPYAGGVDDDEGPDDGIVRAKWLIDGAVTLADAADRLQAEAERLRVMHGQGWTFTQPIEDDYGFLRKPAGSAMIVAG